MRSAHHLITDIVESLEQAHPGLLQDESLLVVLEAQNEEQAAQSLLRASRFSGLLILVLREEVGAKMLAEPCFAGARVDLAKVPMEPGFCRFVMAAEGRCRGGRIWRPSAGPKTDLAQAEARVTVLVEAAENRLLAQDGSTLADGIILVINETGAPDLPSEADSLLTPTGDHDDVLRGICVTTIPVAVAIELLIHVELQDIADKIIHAPPAGSSYALVLIGEHTALTTFERPWRAAPAEASASSFKTVSLEQLEKDPTTFQQWVKVQVEKSLPPIIQRYPLFAERMGHTHVVGIVAPESVLDELMPEVGRAALRDRPGEHAVAFPIAIATVEKLLTGYMTGERKDGRFTAAEASDMLATLARVSTARPLGECVVLVSRGKKIGVMRISWRVGVEEGVVHEERPKIGRAEPVVNAKGGEC